MDNEWKWPRETFKSQLLVWPSCFLSTHPQQCTALLQGNHRSHPLRWRTMRGKQIGSLSHYKMNSWHGEQPESETGWIRKNKSCYLANIILDFFFFFTTKDCPDWYKDCSSFYEKFSNETKSQLHSNERKTKRWPEDDPSPSNGSCTSSSGLQRGFRGFSSLSTA